MASTHLVQQGEHLSSIANQYGFTDYTVIWNDPNNATLKQQRLNPNVLLAGDSVYIPDKHQKSENGATTQRHIFNLKQSALMLRLVFEDSYEKPVADAPCTLYIEQQNISAATDGSGKLEKRISPSSTTATVVLSTDETAFQNDLLQISIGTLDPIESLSGRAARLNNLGYFAGTPATADDAQFKSAVEEFQCDNPPLKVDGDLGPQTQDRLKQLHGC